MSRQLWYDDPAEGPWWTCRLWRRPRYCGVKIGPLAVSRFKEWGSTPGATWGWMIELAGYRLWEWQP